MSGKKIKEINQYWWSDKWAIHMPNRMVVKCLVSWTIEKNFLKVANRYIAISIAFTGSNSLTITTILSVFEKRLSFDCFSSGMAIKSQEQSRRNWIEKKVRRKANCWREEKKKFTQKHNDVFVFEVLNWLHYLFEYKTKIDSSVNYQPLANGCSVCALQTVYIVTFKWITHTSLFRSVKLTNAHISFIEIGFLFIFIPSSYKHVMSYRI